MKIFMALEDSEVMIMSDGWAICDLRPWSGRWCRRSWTLKYSGASSMVDSGQKRVIIHYCRTAFQMANLYGDRYYRQQKCDNMNEFLSKISTLPRHPTSKPTTNLLSLWISKNWSYPLNHSYLVPRFDLYWRTFVFKPRKIQAKCLWSAWCSDIGVGRRVIGVSRLI